MAILTHNVFVGERSLALKVETMTLAVAPSTVKCATEVTGVGVRISSGLIPQLVA